MNSPVYLELTSKRDTVFLVSICQKKRFKKNLNGFQGRWSAFLQCNSRVLILSLVALQYKLCLYVILPEMLRFANLIPEEPSWN